MKWFIGASVVIAVLAVTTTFISIWSDEPKWDDTAGFLWVLTSAPLIIYTVMKFVREEYE